MLNTDSSEIPDPSSAVSYLGIAWRKIHKRQLSTNLKRYEKRIFLQHCLLCSKDLFRTQYKLNCFHSVTWRPLPFVCSPPNKPSLISPTSSIPWTRSTSTRTRNGSSLEDRIRVCCRIQKTCIRCFISPSLCNHTHTIMRELLGSCRSNMMWYSF